MGTALANHRRRETVRWGLLISLLAGLALIVPAAASAATITVTTSSDELGSGPRCSLREAVWAANNNSSTMAQGCRAGSGNDTVVVPAGSYRLTRTTPQTTPPTAGGLDEDAGVYGDLDVTAPLTVTHTGLNAAVIDADSVTERAIENLSQLTIRGMTIRGSGSFSSVGGGILNSGGTLNLQSSTIYDNVASLGGGVANQGGSSTLRNVTLSANRAQLDGGGLLVSGGSATLGSVTLTSNETQDGDGAGFFVAGGGTVKFQNTLDAGNFDDGGEKFDCGALGGTIVSLGHNLVGNANGCNYARRGGDIRNVPAQILDLLDNGGPTLTAALKKTSPAINKGAGCGGFDQRGVPRAMGGPCDIGAWELARCQGVVINQVGTPGPELLIGTSTADGFLGLGGSDTLRAGGGNDGLCGGSGNDRLEGGPGNDHLDGGPGRDTCLPAPGRDSVLSCEVTQ